MFSKITLGSAIAGLLLLLVGLSISMVIPGIAFAGGAKVEVCHVPPGNPDNFHTIKINSNALTAHLGHADLAEACNGLCATICDDGDACTIDDTADCEDAGCPAFPAPVDCDDSNLCTVDSCDSALGCANEPVTCEAPDACSVSACDPLDGSCATTPITCPTGFTCDPVDGCVEDIPDPVACPCFTLADLQAEGAMLNCADDFIAEGAVNFFQNFSYYCSGTDGCTQDSSGNPVTGCGVLSDYDANSGWATIFAAPASDEEDAACRALLQANCPSTASGSAAASAGSEPSIPPIVVNQ